MKNEYEVGVYTRVSREDGDKPESDSIANQKKLCKDFLKSHPEMHLCNIYEDDGYTGVNFERPSFLRLIEDIRNKKINCVVVKDLSRFGRNWLEAGRYIQHIFPCLGIRFIAINDNYDSLNADAETTGLILPIRNLINETYAGDISQKTRSNFEVKRKNGEYVGAFVPYGYKRSIEDKHKLVIDIKVVNVVKDIFRWTIQGVSQNRIAAILNERGIPSPMEYRISEGEKFQTSFKKNLRTKWSAVAIKRILTNEVYLGHLVQGKKGSMNYKDKVMKLKPECEWIRVENTHEAIISKADFDLVQKILQFDTRISPVGEKLFVFSGVLFCGDCKQNMVRRTVARGNKKYFYYRCSTHKKDSKKCSQHNISENKLFETVVAVLNCHIEQVIEMEEIISFLDSLPKETSRVKSVEDEIVRLRSAIESKEKKKKGLYDDLCDGIITKSDFRTFYNGYTNEIAELEMAIEKCNAEVETLSDNSYLWIEDIKNYRNITKLDREIVLTLIDKIYVYESGRIEIKYTYSDEYAAMLERITAFRDDKAVI